MENTQWNRQSPHELTPVRMVRQTIVTVHTIVGGSLFGVGMFVFALHFFFSNNAAILSLMITGGSLALAGAIELIIAAVFRRLVRNQQANLARLKAEGYSFPGEIVRIQYNPRVRIGHSFSAYAECSYINHEGKTCLVKSMPFLCKNNNFHLLHGRLASHDPPECRLAVWVYVSPYDPADYAVEIFT